MKALHVRTSGNSRDFSTSVPAGSVTAPVADEVTVEFTTPVELADGDNRLWLTFDVADDIDSDIIIDAEARALVLSDGSRLAIEEGNPEGHSVTQNIYLMPSGEDNTVTVTRTLQFYDDGGADGNISMSFNGKVTFLPGKPGTAVYIDTPREWIRARAALHEGLQRHRSQRRNPHRQLHGTQRPCLHRIRGRKRGAHRNGKNEIESVGGRFPLPGGTPHP